MTFRILHVLDHSIPLHSGYSFRTKAIIEHQRQMGWETFHVTGSKQGNVRKLEDDCDGLHFYRTKQLNILQRNLPIWNQWAVVRQLAKRCKKIIPEIKPNILHAHSPVLDGLAALKAKRKFGLPLVYEIRAFWEDAAVDHRTTTEGSLRYKLTHELETFMIQRADHVTTICEGLRSDIISRGIAAEKVSVIPNGVNLDEFKKPDLEQVSLLKEKYQLNDQTVLGFIGSFYAYEGLELLLHALPRILHRVTNTKLLLVGGGFESGRLNLLSERLGIADKVIFTGRVAHEQVKNYYELVDILVYPRLSMRLTELVTPLKPLEAMAVGRLVVASDVGGHKELIKDGQTGVLFKAGDELALADAVTNLILHRERWPAQRVAARRYVEHERNWAYVVAKYQSIYTNLLHHLDRGGKD